MRFYTVERLRVNWKGLLTGLLWLCLGAPVVAQSDAELFPPKPEPAVYVHDYAGWLSPAERQQLEQKLVRYHDSTSTQIVVMIRPDLGDYDKATYAFELGNRWGIGRKSLDNGVVMLIKSQPPDRGIFIATGYGTEGALPDVLAGRIIRSVMAPYFQQQQYYGGINAGTDAIIGALSGEFKADPQEQGEALPGWVGLLIFIAIIALFLFIARKVRNSTMYDHNGPRSSRGGGWWMGPWIGGGGGGFGGGGSWGGGGGFGGGGGSFGGGSFGGGGAGGDW